MTEILNEQAYNNGMKKSLLDKIFFIDKIDATTFVDYGCADGTLLNYIGEMFPAYKYYGYDISENMIKLANKNKTNNNITFTTSFDNILGKISRSTDKKVLILSSVIHEVYAYAPKKDIELFWERVFNSNFDYIVIRDMVLDNHVVDRATSSQDLVNLFYNANDDKLQEFQDIYGSVKWKDNFIHYLLKYRYVENWNREVRENYLPLTKQELLRLVPRKYKVILEEHYILPFLKERIKKDFSIVLTDNTHIKIILKREI